MRYLIPKSQSNEIHGRHEYLYDIFHLYFFPHESNDDYIQLCPVGSTGPDLMFIIGHNDQVVNFIRKNIDSIQESNIIVTTCFAEHLNDFSYKKQIYVPIIKGDICKTRPGKPYGFEFDITDAELRLYNSSGAIFERVKKGYRLINI